MLPVENIFVSLTDESRVFDLDLLPDSILGEMHSFSERFNEGEKEKVGILGRR